MRWIFAEFLLLLSALGSGACGSTGPSARDPVFVMGYDATPPLETPALLQVTLSSGSFRRTISGTTFTTAGGVTPHSEQMVLPVTAALQIRVTLASGADTLADGSIQVLIQEGFQYGATLYAGRGDPRTFNWVVCVPSVHSLPLRHRPAGFTADTVYLAWGGLPKGAIC